MLSFIEYMLNEAVSPTKLKNLEFLKQKINSYGYTFVETMKKTSGKIDYTNIRVYTKDSSRDFAKRNAVICDIFKRFEQCSDIKDANILIELEKNTKPYEIKCNFLSDQKKDYIRIVHKPSSDGVTKTNPGVENEHILANAINLACEEGPINIKFTDGKNTVVVNDVIDADGDGTNTKNRKKGDITLNIKSGKYPISIKKDNAKMWESSDTLFGHLAKDVFERLYLLKKIKYTTGKIKVGKELETYYTIDKEFQVKITDIDLVRNICFGKDIKGGNGLIVTKDFDKECLIKEKDNTYICKVSWLASANDVQKIIDDKNHCPYLVVGNNANRGNRTMGYRGIRLRVYMGKRGNNIPVIDPDKLPTLRELKDMANMSDKEMKDALRDMSESAE